MTQTHVLNQGEVRPGIYHIDIKGKGVVTEFVRSIDPNAEELITVGENEKGEQAYVSYRLEDVISIRRNVPPKYFKRFNVPYEEMDLSKLDQLQPGEYYLEHKQMTAFT